MSQLLVLFPESKSGNLLQERRMNGARTGMLARLRSSIERIETGEVNHARRVALGHGEADAALHGGLALGAMHEVFSAGRHSAAATGFIAGLARRVTARQP